MEDYYELEDRGCCLHCEDSYEGCLCYNCKCSKCIHYSGNDPDADVKNEDTGGEVCLLPIYWKDHNDSKSHFKINKIIRQTQKAIQCTLINIKTGELSDKPFWIPLSVLDKNYVKNWFADKEIRSEFNKNVESQLRLV